MRDPLACSECVLPQFSLALCCCWRCCLCAFLLVRSRSLASFSPLDRLALVRSRFLAFSLRRRVAVVVAAASTFAFAASLLLRCFVCVCVRARVRVCASASACVCLCVCICVTSPSLALLRDLLYSVVDVVVLLVSLLRRWCDFAAGGSDGCFSCCCCEGESESESEMSNSDNTGDFESRANEGRESIVKRAIGQSHWRLPSQL